MTESIVNALPFIVSNFGDPVIISNLGEYTVLCNSDKKVFLFKSQELIDAIPNKSNPTIQTQVSKKISIRLFSSPVIIATNGSPQVVLYINNQFKCERIPVFTMAKYCTILSPTLFIVADQDSAYYWDISSNKCKLCFSSEKEIVSLDHYRGKTFIFTTNSFEILSTDSPSISLSFYCPPLSWIRHSLDFEQFYVLNGTEITPLSVTADKIIRKEAIQLEARPYDFSVFGDSLLVLFGAKEGRKRVVRRYYFETKTWSNSIDVPIITAMCTCGNFVLAACSQFTLVLHESSELFDKLNGNAQLLDLLLLKFEDMKSFRIFLLFFGLDCLSNELSSHNVSSESLVHLVLDELWERELFDQWGLLALEWPKYLKSRHSSDRIIELQKTRKFDVNSNIRFAALLEASNDYWNAFLIYLSVKNVESVSTIMNNVIDRIEPYINDIIDLCSYALKSNKKESAMKMLHILATNQKIAKPEKIIPHLMFSWELLDMYYKGFDEKHPAPTDVANSYLNALAIYQPSKLHDFLCSNHNYDVARACDSLLKLGCLDEYGYLLAQTNVKNYLEFLVLREDWNTLFGFLEINKKEWPYVLQMMSFDRSYFIEFVKHFDMLNISLSEFISEIPKESEPTMLAEGFNVLTKIISSRNESEEIVEDICCNESFRLFEELLISRSEGMIIDV